MRRNGPDPHRRLCRESSAQVSEVPVISRDVFLDDFAHLTWLRNAPQRRPPDESFQVQPAALSDRPRERRLRPAIQAEERLEGAVEIRAQIVHRRHPDRAQLRNVTGKRYDIRHLQVLKLALPVVDRPPAGELEERYPSLWRLNLQRPSRPLAGLLEHGDVHRRRPQHRQVVSGRELPGPRIAAETIPALEKRVDRADHAAEVECADILQGFPAGHVNPLAEKYGKSDTG